MCDNSIVIICVKQLLLFVSTECDCLCFVCDNDWTVSDGRVLLLVLTNGLFVLNELKFYDLSRNLSVTLQTNIKDMNFLYDCVLGIIAGK